MRWSKTFIPTLRDVPAEAQVKSHVLMLRAGVIRQLSAGVYSFLHLGWKSMLKAIAIIREEMNRAGGQEILMPLIHPREIWQETGRDKDMGEIMFRFEDRKGQGFCLAPTHEEIITDIARGELRSYKELPQTWYHIQTKFRDEPRPRSGLLRVREFIMKDSYTLCATQEQLDAAYIEQREAYRRIFDRCGLRYYIVGASSGLMGGSGSEEFMVQSDAGEDIIAICDCGFSQNLEIARSIPKKVEWVDTKKEKVHTPNRRTIEEVSTFLKLPAGQMLKSLLYITQSGKPKMACLRGDHELSEEKLNRVAGEICRPAEPEEALKFTNTQIGYIGPIGIEGKIDILIDEAVDPEMPFATGALEEDYHITGYKLTDVKNFKIADLRQVAQGDFCERCGAELNLTKAIEIGHIFKLGTKYSKAMGATFLDENGESKPIVMGSYGIGVGRLLSAAIELYSDEDGICFPISIAPFEAIVTALNVSDEKISSTAEKIYSDLQSHGVDVLYDDRDMQAGAKFKDADLIGIPIRITVGKGVAKGIVEIVNRRTKEKVETKIEDAINSVLDLKKKLFDDL